MKFRLILLRPTVFSSALLTIVITVVLCGCNSGQNVQNKEVVSTPEEINVKAEDLIKNTLDGLLRNPSSFPDSIRLKNTSLLREIYKKNNYGLLWSSKGVFNKEADSLLSLIDSAQLYGLFPSDYYVNKLHLLQTELAKVKGDSTNLDASKWSYADMLSTSAFVQFIKDLKVGRLLPDSVLIKDTSLQADFFSTQKQLFSTKPVGEFAAALEPANNDYQKLKEALRAFLPKANMRNYTLVRGKDTTQLRKLIYQRINEEDSIELTDTKKIDSLAFTSAVKKYQRLKKMKEDGKISAALVNRLNTTDKEKFIRIAITLDKYKMLPLLPEDYIWVNLPGYYLEVREADTVALTSKIICGKPTTRTPQLSSAITDMITYPQWTIPESIIKKEILPGLKGNPGYTERRGYSLVDLNGNEVSPYSVNWAKYKNSIPYKVVQGSGDANALGVMKFNFSNPYAVYLHDTNQRYLFERSSRALSHGCVRVQKWKELAYYILRKDSTADSSKTISTDSLNNLLAEKKKRVIRVRQQLPLFIRYFTAEGKAGKLILHEDIYEEDKRLREKLFASK